MNISIIGAGNVGSALGKKLYGAGHNITYGVRNINDEKYTDLNDHAQLKLPNEAIEKSDVIFLATPWGATKDAITSLGEKIDGKILVDCTNPLKPNLSGLEFSGDTSGGEQVAKWAEGAVVVKAFNTTGYNIMVSPEINGNKTAMFIASDDEKARGIVKVLAQDIGFDAIEFGGLESSRLLEPYALMWISLAYKHGFGRDYGFAVHKRKES